MVSLNGVITDSYIDVPEGDPERLRPPLPGRSTIIELEVVDPQIESGAGRGCGRVRRSGLPCRTWRRTENGPGPDDVHSLESQPPSEDHGPGDIQEDRVGREFPEDGASSGDGAQGRVLEAQGKVEGVDRDLLRLEPQARCRFETAGGLGEEEAIEGAETDKEKDRGRDEDEQGRGDESETRRSEGPFCFFLRHRRCAATSYL